MTKQKCQIGEAVWLREIGGAQLPLYEAEIIGFVETNKDPYRIRYQKPGDPTFWIDDFAEDRLISFLEIALQNKQ